MSEVGDYWKPQLEKADATILRLSAIIDNERAENERLRAALKPLVDAIAKAETELPHDQHERLTYCREQLTLYEFGNARRAYQQSTQTQLGEKP